MVRMVVRCGQGCDFIYLTSLHGHLLCARPCVRSWGHQSLPERSPPFVGREERHNTHLTVAWQVETKLWRSSKHSGFWEELAFESVHRQEKVKRGVGLEEARLVRMFQTEKKLGAKTWQGWGVDESGALRSLVPRKQGVLVGRRSKHARRGCGAELGSREPHRGLAGHHTSLTGS